MLVLCCCSILVYCSAAPSYCITVQYCAAPTCYYRSAAPHHVTLFEKSFLPTGSDKMFRNLSLTCLWSITNVSVTKVSLLWCLLFHVFCIMSPVSCLLSRVSCIMSPVSRLLSHVSCLISPVSRLLSHVSYLTFLVLHVVSLFKHDSHSELVDSW